MRSFFLASLCALSLSLSFAPVGAFAEDPSPSDLKSFLHQVHEGLGAEHTLKKGDVKALIGAALLSMNPKHMFLQARRLYNMSANEPRYVEHAKNLAFLLPMSESLEFSTGPFMNWLVLNTNLPHWLESIMVGGGYMVSIPFVVEPFCGTLIFAYATFPRFRDGVTRLRVKVSTSARNLCEATGLSTAMVRLFPRAEVLRTMMAAGWQLQWDDPAEESGRIVLRSADDRIQLHVAAGGSVGAPALSQDLYVEHIFVRGEFTRRSLRRQLKGLGWSSRELLVMDFPRRQSAEDTYEKTYHPHEIPCGRLLGVEGIQPGSPSH